jgi:hypothetical protein
VPVVRYVLPTALVVCLALLFLIAPHLEPQRLRSRARRVTEDLRTRHGFRAGSKAAWGELRATGWPPFHYGRHAAVDGELIGTVHGIPVRVAGYEVVTNGWRHRYGLAAVVLPRPVEWMEVRGERPFAAARVPEHVPDGLLTLGVPEFDAGWSVYADTQDALLVAGSRQLAETMLALPTRLSWRTHESELLLWKRDGWTGATELLAALSAVMNLLGLVGSDLPDLLG